MIFKINSINTVAHTGFNLIEGTAMIKQMSVTYTGFYKAWRMLECKTDLTLVDDYTIPWIVNGALACEIGMKYILAQNKMEVPKMHLLHELYNKLPDTHRAEISDRLFSAYPTYEMEQFNQEILLLSNAFCEFRYSYEHALSLDLQFFRTWCSAIFEQVEKYPSYKLVEDYSERSISEDDFDKKFHYTHNQMLSRLNRKSK